MNRKLTFLGRAVLLVLLLGGVVNAFAQNKTVELQSPDGKLKVVVELRDKIYYSIEAGEQKLLQDNHMGLDIGQQVLGANPVLLSVKKVSGNDVIKPYVALKYAEVPNHYNGVVMNFKGDYAVEFRAFDQGVAYRFITKRKGELKIQAEDFSIHFPANYLLHLQQSSGFKTSYEEAYRHIGSDTLKTTDKIATLPALIDTKTKYKILISESDLSDYPGMFVKGNGDNGLTGTFPKVPLSFGPDGDRSLKILKKADYIAATTGDRTFPWRYFVISEKDGDLIENTMTLKLARPSEIKDPSWIKPGQASWEWWNGATPYGPDVNFVAGCNLDTYKYFIDFAAKYGIKYIVMDEGWAKSTTDPYTPNPDVNLQELIRYGKSKNVGIVLWLTWLTVDKNMGLFKTFHEWGIKGVKIDFMDRSDQWMVNYYEKVIKEAAKNHLFVDFHGAFKPSGLEYRYPNLLSYEGVKGLEQMSGCYPDNSIYLPFMRNAVGPMDFTPGAMINMQPDVYRAARPNAASVGTRVGQMALYVIFESGIQMLADNPTLYYKNPDCASFITSVPVTWDETRVLDATVGDLVSVAKRKGKKWFIGAIVNGQQKERKSHINFDFLDKNKHYTMTYFEDGINAGTQGMDYRKKVRSVDASQQMDIQMARNGGWAAVIEEK